MRVGVMNSEMLYRALFGESTDSMLPRKAQQ